MCILSSFMSFREAASLMALGPPSAPVVFVPQTLKASETRQQAAAGDPHPHPSPCSSETVSGPVAAASGPLSEGLPLFLQLLPIIL